MHNADDHQLLAEADEQIARARRLMGEQRRIVEEMAAAGHDAGEADRLFVAMAEMLKLFEFNRALIVQRIAAAEAREPAAGQGVIGAGRCPPL